MKACSFQIEWIGIGPLSNSDGFNSWYFSDIKVQLTTLEGKFTSLRDFKCKVEVGL